MDSTHSFLLNIIWDKNQGILVIYQSYNHVENWPKYFCGLTPVEL